jgi:muramoyltetrapeptide carboxypeptidase LdcA involved in peptidoglycan recycling
MTGLRTFYGPSAIVQFGEVGGALDFTAEHFLHVLSPASQRDDAIGNPKPVGNVPRSLKWTEEFRDWNNEDPTKPETLKARTLQPNPGWKWLRHGSSQGRIMGGCLPSLL